MPSHTKKTRKSVKTQPNPKFDDNLTEDDFSDYSSHDERGVLGHVFEIDNSARFVDRDTIFMAMGEELDSVGVDLDDDQELLDAMNAHALPSTNADRESAYDELLAWGSGDLAIEGLPDAVLANGQPSWFENAPQYEIEDSEDDSSEEGNERDAESDSSEEAEQDLLMRGLASDTDGETTDSLDDSDHAALARYGIEHDDDNATPSPPRSPKQPAQNDPVKPPSGDAEPVLGEFQKRPAQVVFLDESNHGTVKSPFSIVRSRKRKQSFSSASPIARLRRQSSASSQSTSTSASITAPPSIHFDRPSPPSDIPEESEDAYIDLDLHDVLDATAVSDFDFLVDDSDNDNAVFDASQITSLARWKTVPMGAFRRQGTTKVSSALPGTAPALKQRARLSDGVYFLPVRTAVYTAHTSSPHSNGQKSALSGIRRKITKQEAIGLSPMLCPVRSNKITSEAQSRKQRRAERRLKRKAAQRQNSGASMDSTVPKAEPSPPIIDDHEVPTLELPSASTQIPAISVSSPTELAPGDLTAAVPPANLLPAPTLPSAGCVPLSSPFMTASHTPMSVPAMSLSAAAVWIAQDA